MFAALSGHVDSTVRPEGSGWLRVCALQDLSDGTIRRLPLQPPIALAMRDGEVYAFGDHCPHAGALLSRGVIGDSFIECPLHGAQFSLDDGHVLCPPAKRGMRVYRTAVHEGEVYVRIRGRGRKWRLFRRPWHRTT